MSQFHKTMARKTRTSKRGNLNQRVIEVDVSGSKAIGRMVYGPASRDLWVQYTTSDQVYVYKDVDEAFVKLFSVAASIGRAVSEIKKRHRVVCEAGFPEVSKPKEKRRRKHSRKDCSAEWLQLVDSPQGGLLDLSVYRHLLSVVDSVRHNELRCPPSFGPPKSVIEGRLTGAEVLITDQLRQLTLNSSNSNPFHELSGSEEEDEVEGDDSGSRDDSPVDTLSPEAISSGAISNRKSIQWRYLRYRLICCIIECLRAQAIQRGNDKLWKDSADLWCEAYDFGDVASAVAAWKTMLLLHREEGIPLDEGHDVVQLQETLTALDVVLDDTKREKDAAVGRMLKRLSYLQHKLNPLLEDRDRVKRRYGEYNWTHNPEPKKTYAERRLELEKECAELVAAIPRVEPLNFNSRV